LIQIGIILAVACALVTNLAFFFKQRGAKRAPAVKALHPLQSGRGLFASRWFTIGMLVAAVAWILHVAAMTFAPLVLVQVVLAGGIVVVGLMADHVFGIRVDRRQWLGLTLTAVGLVAFAMTVPGGGGAHSTFSPTGMIIFEAGLCALGAALIAGPSAGAPRRHHGTMLGAATGILFGASDVSIKALTGIAGAHGVVGLVLSPWLAVTLLASIVGFFTSAKSLQDGEAVPVIAITSASANISAIAGGFLVFGDPLPNDVFGILAQVLGVLAVIGAAALMPSLRTEGSAASAGV
jgi:drug/metabolite transporter (DMT)-like permease